MLKYTLKFKFSSRKLNFCAHWQRRILQEAYIGLEAMDKNNIFVPDPNVYWRNYDVGT